MNVHARIPWPEARWDNVLVYDDGSQPSKKMKKYIRRDNNMVMCQNCDRPIPAAQWCMRCTSDKIAQQVSENQWRHDGSPSPIFRLRVVVSQRTTAIVCRFKYELIARLRHLEQQAKQTSKISAREMIDVQSVKNSTQTETIMYVMCAYHQLK